MHASTSAIRPSPFALPLPHVCPSSRSTAALVRDTPAVREENQRLLLQQKAARATAKHKKRGAGGGWSRKKSGEDEGPTVVTSSKLEVRGEG